MPRVGAPKVKGALYSDPLPGSSFLIDCSAGHACTLRVLLRRAQGSGVRGGEMKQQKTQMVGANGGGEALGLRARQVKEGGRAVSALERWLMRRLIKASGDPPITFRLWDGQDFYTPADSVGRVTFRDPSVLWRCMFSPEVAFGDAYSDGRMEVTGDLVSVLFCLYRAMEKSGPNAGKRGLVGRLPRAARNTQSGSRRNIHHHYDLGNDFYKLWLDEHMVYTCAYYPNQDLSLAQAQTAKMDHVCRKLRLERGQTVVEAGCGWGALAMHMARHYGVKVKAFNISQQQLAYARERAHAEGLDGQVEFIEDDYRNIAGQFDAFVSVGMLEHVGPENYEELGNVVVRALKSSGLGLIHSVGRSRPMAVNGWLEQRIFPGSYPPSLREMMSIFERHNVSIIDVENLRLHYAQTLVDWLNRFDEHVDTIREMYDEPFVRAWRLYLAGCAASFMSSSIQLFQVVFAPSENNGVPRTRAHIYRDDHGLSAQGALSDDWAQDLGRWRRL